jgi:hypothetical protein
MPFLAVTSARISRQKLATTGIMSRVSGTARRGANRTSGIDHGEVARRELDGRAAGVKIPVHEGSGP